LPVSRFSWAIVEEGGGMRVFFDGLTEPSLKMWMLLDLYAVGEH
jgi:hypothetical protein